MTPWRLLPLQRKAEWDLELARSRLAHRLEEAATSARSLRSLQERQAEQVAHVSASARLRSDPNLHAQCLAYLQASAAGIAAARDEHARAQARIAAARADCLRCRQRLDTVESLHEQAVARQAQQARWQQAKEADLAWLVQSAQRGGE